MNILARRVFAGWTWVEESMAPGTSKDLGNKTQQSSTSVSKQSGLIIAQYFKW